MVKKSWLILLLIFIVLITILILKNSKKSNFNAELWKAQHKSQALLEDNPRIGMVSGLLKERLLEGTEKTKVLELLGDPERTESTKDFYELGRSPFGISYETLVIEYRNEKIARAYIRRT